MSVTMAELFKMEGRTVAIGRGVQATMRQVGPAVEVCFEGLSGTAAYVVIEDGHRFGEEGCAEARADALRFCPRDLDQLETDVVEIRNLGGLRRFRSEATADAARLSA